MMCLPTSPPALRTCLGLGLFVLLCLGMGKQKPGWECGKGLGTSSSTHGMVNRGWWPSGHSWCLLPGLSPGFGAAGTLLRSPQLPRPLQQAAGSQTGMVISHSSQGERNAGVFGQLMSVGSTWHSPWASVSVAAWFPQLLGVQSGCVVEKIGKGGSLGCCAPPGQLSTEQSSFSNSTNSH